MMASDTVQSAASHGDALQIDSTTLQIDNVALSRYLEHCVDGFSGPLTLSKFSGGQSNPTFRLDAASGQYVLRCQPPGQLLKSAHAVDREYRVQRALQGSDVPVAKMFHLCEESSVIGVKFYLMSYERGDIFWDPALPTVSREQRHAYYEELIRILASLHNVDLAAAGLDDFGRAGNYFERQIGIWSKQYRASETRLIEPMEALMAWVVDNRPPDDDAVALVHGDYRCDNIVFRTGAPQGLAVLDWELSTLGHPLADLAYFCLCLRLPANEHRFGLGGMDRRALGIPDEEFLVERYCALRGIGAVVRWDFYLAFSFFRLAAILQGVFKRALDGNASNRNALAMGSMVEELAALALQTVHSRGGR